MLKRNCRWLFGISFSIVWHVLVAQNKAFMHEPGHGWWDWWHEMKRGLLNYSSQWNLVWPGLVTDESLKAIIWVWVETDTIVGWWMWARSNFHCWKLRRTVRQTRHGERFLLCSLRFVRRLSWATALSHARLFFHGWVLDEIYLAMLKFNGFQTFDRSQKWKGFLNKILHGL